MFKHVLTIRELGLFNDMLVSISDEDFDRLHTAMKHEAVHRSTHRKAALKENYCRCRGCGSSHCANDMVWRKSDDGEWTYLCTFCLEYFDYLHEDTSNGY